MAFWSQKKLLKAGDRAPEFLLKDMEGTPRSLEEIRKSGPAVLAFFKVSCPVCQYTFPFLERMAGGALRFFGISQDGPKPTRSFLSSCGVTFPVLLDDAGYKVSNGFGISIVPSLFLVEPDGSVSLVSEGFVKRDLEELGRRAGQEPFRAADSVPEWKPG